MTTPHDGSQPNFHFEVYCPVEKQLLNILRRFITNVAEEMGFAEEDISKIEIAVDEACSNVVQHAYAKNPLPSQRTGIDLKLLLEPMALTIHIQDHGQGPGSGGLRGEPSLQAYQAPGKDRYRGLGILIMKEFMDEVHFQSDPDNGTRVMLRKFLKSSRDKRSPGYQ
ncbi:MAG: ATP-binding protein [bacterium]|nr:ATP-binding protein [bacterium]